MMTSSLKPSSLVVKMQSVRAVTQTALMTVKVQAKNQRSVVLGLATRMGHSLHTVCGRALVLVRTFVKGTCLSRMQ